MGNYNPHAPYILGNEWVPIRDARYTPEDFVERGYAFRIDHSVVPITGAYYVAEVPQKKVDQASDLISVYPSGIEQLSGPVKKLNIPVSAIAITGTAITAADGYAALLNPSDDSYVTFVAPSDNNSFLAINFDVSTYSQQLTGKRILDVSFRYSMSTGSQFAGGTAADALQVTTSVGFIKDMVNYSYNYNLFGLETTVGGQATEINSFSITDLNAFWDSTRQPYDVRDIYPWRYQELNRFSAGTAAASRMVLQFFNGISSESDANLYFVDMEITYCEETRVLYGGRRTQGFNTYDKYEVGANLVRLLDTNFATATTSLSPGEYVVTLMHNDFHIQPGRDGAPKVNALRELYQLPQQRGLNLVQSLVVDGQFTEEESPVITELTLHTAAAVVTGVHAYGLQQHGPVYDGIEVIQGIEDDPVGTARSYPQVRFYARRFGETTVSLTLGSVAGLYLPGTAGSYASTPDNAALDIVGDIDIRIDATIDDWTPSVGVSLIGKWTESTNNRSYFFYLDTNGTLNLAWSTNGVAVLSAASTAAVPVAAGRLAVRVVLDVDNGAAGRTVTFYTSNTISGSWTQLGTPVTTAGVTSIFSSTAIVEIGTHTVGTLSPLNGVVHAAEIRNSVGTTVANPDFAAQATGTTSFVDAAGRTWTINSTAEIIGSSSVSITPDELDALTEIVDGWREVNLRFTSAPSFETTTIVPKWQWSAVGEAAYNQWQVLAAGSYAPATQATSPATYYAPFGSLVNMTWKSDFYADVQNDINTDATLIFATDPPSVTGFALSVETQAVTGITEGCAPNGCIPSGIDYIEVSWTALSGSAIMVTGGTIELQRSDELTDWQTILLTEDLTTALYRDFEARVDILSSYRIRTLNLLDFAGAWVTGSATIPNPGVTVSGTGNSVLIFTSNEDPSANLAYTMVWEGQPIETFVFPEADELQLQRMYGKDFFTAFHPLERGGDQFTRSLLVNAAAIPAPSLANFRGLRDLGWASLNYVCVRDELGNRWFANILVPESNVRMNRTKYVAQIQVSEVTDTATPLAEAV